MALLDDKLFITKEAFEKYRDVSEHLDAERANSSILEAQIVDLIEIVGPPLYRLLQADFTAPDTWATPKYAKLFDGIEYTPKGEKYSVRYHGLQPMLTLFSYARYLNNAQLNVTRTGPVTYTEADVSEPPTQAQIKTKVIDARAMAVRYQQEVITYLESNGSDFPEWKNPHIKNKAFQFIKL